MSIKSFFQSDIAILRRENQLIREGGAHGGAGSSTPQQSRSQQISRELRLAASTAESNLR